MTRESQLTQPQRLLSLFIDVSIVATACVYLFGSIYPPVGDKGYWAYSALLGVLVGSKLVTPYYVKPVDAISYAVPAFVSLMLINQWGLWTTNLRWGFSLAASFSALIFALGLANIVTNSLKSDWAETASNQLRLALELLGQPRFIYTPLALFAVFAFHSGNWLEAVVILMVVGLVVWWSFGDFLIGLYQKLINALSQKKLKGVAGELVAFQDPGLVLLRQQSEGDIKKHDILYVGDRHGPKKLVVALDLVGRFEGILVRTVDLGNVSAASQSLISGSGIDGTAYHLSDDTLDEVCGNQNIDRAEQKQIVGLVSQDTAIDKLYFEVVDNTDLESGRLVSARVADKKVLYQIVAGMTKEEVVLQKNTFGFIRGQSQQIGIWDPNNRKFTYCGWLPTMNTPVYLVQKSEYQIRPESIGHFPDTDFHAEIKSISDLVTHNTAILGILGVGKSMLAIELVERMIAAGIKVICLDMTNQYATELTDFHDPAYETACHERLHTASETDREAFADNPEEGGSLPNLRQAIHDDLREFLDPANPRMFKVYNPAIFSATRQFNEPRSFRTEDGNWDRGAALWSVTPVAVTQIISEATLDLLSDEMTDEARACLVYEEAHSLVPEWNSVVVEGDKSATTGSARAILQGRKFGLGCLLVTQRTANVTKSILNQCNTIFAMRSFDQTGKEFLSNYIGKDYAETLSTIPERHAVFFGKASSCENPVLVRLNDQDKFRPAFRAVHQPADLPDFNPETDHPDEAAQDEAPDSFDDDIPF